MTAGNASGIVDGAAMLVVTTAQRAKELGLKPKARIRSWGLAGVARADGPRPVPAIQRCQKAGLKVDDFDLIEINEAFSAAVPRARRNSGSIATSATSTAARSRSATRSAPPARGWC